MEATDYLVELKTLVEKKVDPGKVLDGIGALIDEKERLWVKETLKKELIKKLAIQIEAMS